jgi:hypothetical protein
MIRRPSEGEPEFSFTSHDRANVNPTAWDEGPRKSATVATGDMLPVTITSSFVVRAAGIEHSRVVHRRLGPMESAA